MTPPAAPQRALPAAPDASQPTPSAPTDPLESLAVELARFDLAHPLRRQHRARGNDYLVRLEANRRQLVANYRATVRAADSGGWISPAGEWLLDNFHVIAEQLREGREDLPRPFYRGLPALSAGPHAGRPRAFALAAELIAATDGLLDVDALERFLAAYQALSPLTIGELWAIPIALRLAFLDRLAVIAARVDRARREREAAARLAEELAAIATKSGGKRVGETLEARVSRRVAPSTTMFATELAYRLRDRHPALALATAWLERRFADQGQSLEEAIRAEHRSQAANQLSVGNCITSMRTITATDWSEVFEKLSVVERVLRTDPARAYAAMDFATRDRYRHAVEQLSRRTTLAEADVARTAIALAQNGTGPRATHVGYFLIDDGRPELEARIGYHPPLGRRLTRWAARHRTLLYLGPIIVGTAVIATLVGRALRLVGMPLWAALLCGAVSVFAASDLVAALVNLVTTLLRGPTPLPKLDFSTGIPAEHATLVVVPMMLGNETGIGAQIEALEIRYLGNQDASLRFALLADHLDAQTEETDEDHARLAAAQSGIERLNTRYGHDRFFLFHRRREWSESEQRFIGWERKRGKLAQLNRLLLGQPTSLELVVGRADALDGTELVLTLDADTQLPMGSAQRLIGTMAHPLNRPRVDGNGAVIAGYGVLQPRISISPASAQTTRYARLYADQDGIDPYTSAVSDVYQDVFDEGSYVGKGLYDVRAFEAAVQGAIPDGAVLSHDLLEGLLARTALVSDVELFDDTPSNYLAASHRRHRWVRGDWQVVPWLTATPPRADGARRPNPLSPIDRWKIVDNLRRSLVPPTTMALLFCGWLATGRPLLWTVAVALLLALPILGHALAAAVRRPTHADWALHLGHVAADTAHVVRRAALAAILLPYEAWVSTDAIFRALYRRHISKRGLLEWTPAAQVEGAAPRQLARFYGAMAPATLLALALTATAMLVRWRWLVLDFLPVAAAWAAAPLVAYVLSQSRPDKPEEPLSAVARYFLRRTARKTWRYFATFVGADDHFLPPDNFQDSPRPLLAHRTSPTNMGLSLVCNLSAVDLGYIGRVECAERLEQALATMEKLERHNGHFLNWYDSKTLLPLTPRYVSTVDSGNLAAMLVALTQGCQNLAAAPVAVLVDGLLDTLRLADEEIDRVPGGSGLRARLADVEALLARPPAVDESPRAWLDELGQCVPAPTDLPPHSEAAYWLSALARQIESHRQDQPSDDAELRERFAHLGRRAAALLDAMDFRFLYHPGRGVFTIGYDVAAERADRSFYDLLASEARLASFVAIAKGDVPVKHWYRLGRPLTRVGRRRALLSWTGTMFEYLMPALLLRSFAGTLLDESRRAVVERQIAYGRQRRVPWGISESAYNTRDLSMNYQYGPFGCPGLGIKRGLAEDLVVAPYATALALLVTPRAAVDNLWRLQGEGLDAQYGFCESIDYTPSRVPDGQRGVVVRTFMAHHQGMSLLAMAETLCGHGMKERFCADPRVKTTELLLEERVPYATPLDVAPSDMNRRPQPARVVANEEWRQFSVDADADVHLLSNGSYSVMLSAAGGGYAMRRDLAVTRWQEDPTRDCWGQLIYVRDLHDDGVWSAAPQPLPPPHGAGADYCFSLGQAELRRVDDEIETHLLVTVATEDDAEVRVVKLTNLSHRTRELEVTSYAEVVLMAPGADAAHPAFAKLFVETELQVDAIVDGALLAHRRPRQEGESCPWGVHVSCVEGPSAGKLEHETDRARFLGRGRGVRDAAALRAPLSGSTGAVLDPIFSLRRRVRIAPGKSVRVVFTTAVADTRVDAVNLAHKYADPAAADRASSLAWVQAQSQLHYLGVSAVDARTFRRLAAHVLYANRSLRAQPDVIAQNRRGQSGLWAYGISGDRPIVLVRVEGEEHFGLVRELLHAHELWRMRGLSVDLVILNDHPPSYQLSFHDGLVGVVRAGPSAGLLDRPGGIFVRRAELVPSDDQALLVSVARVVLRGSRGTIAEQLDGAVPPPAMPPPLATRSAPSPTSSTLASSPPASSTSVSSKKLRYENGLGGFTPDGRQYVLHLLPGQTTPAPWVNVLANPSFGAVVSEAGSGYEWAENSHENRLTEWRNDPVSDGATSAIYVRDDDSGAHFSVTPLPAGQTAFTIAHGQGYSTWSGATLGIGHALTVLVAADDPVKLGQLKLTNQSGKRRHLSILYYVELTLGVLRPDAARMVVTSLDGETGALFARNTYPNDVGSRVAFVDSTPRFATCTGDRTEFLGRHGDPAHPAALDRVGLSGRVGAGWDPCAALHLTATLDPDEALEVDLVFGQAADEGGARTLVTRYRTPHAVARALAVVTERWDALLSTVTIRTPDDALDLLVNRWLLYQVTAARLWARTGFYQSGGAFGFRDQLQDVAALLYTRPDLARAQIARAAAHQFVEGDVLHWWHPPTGRGVRTRFADDLLWLPLVTARYLEVTEDHAFLDEEMGFIEARALNDDEHEAYLLPTVSDTRASLYEHLVRACDRCLAVGAHGLPLMGCGDWNDGMNRVGVGGRGESVWMAWFLVTVLDQMVPLCRARGDLARAERYAAHAVSLKDAVEKNAWDGRWYLRAFFDDGTPLGSAAGDECRIDSLAQSWSVISGAGDATRRELAMASVGQELVDEPQRLIKLLAPPFDRTTHDPGYIKGYVPGVRENGGQYTHAATWVVLAETLLGHGDRAGQLLSLLNPVRLTASGADVDRYRVEPYVVVADIAAHGALTGRGGWSWYTGSAAWLYRVVVESLLGLQIRGTTLTVAPTIPSTWDGFAIDYRHGATLYRIDVRNPDHVQRGVARTTLDGKAVDTITLVDDGATHTVEIVLG